MLFFTKSTNFFVLQLLHFSKKIKVIKTKCWAPKSWPIKFSQMKVSWWAWTTRMENTFQTAYNSEEIQVINKQLSLFRKESNKIHKNSQIFDQMGLKYRSARSQCCQEMLLTISVRLILQSFRTKRWLKTRYACWRAIRLSMMFSGIIRIS